MTLLIKTQPFQNIIQDRCAQDPEIISSSSPRLGGVPDALYMLDVAGSSSSAEAGYSSRHHQGRGESGAFSLGNLHGGSFGAAAAGTPMSSTSMMTLQGDPALLEFHTSKLPGTSQGLYILTNRMNHVHSW